MRLQEYSVSYPFSSSRPSLPTAAGRPSTSIDFGVASSAIGPANGHGTTRVVPKIEARFMMVSATQRDASLTLDPASGRDSEEITAYSRCPEISLQVGSRFAKIR